MKIIEPSFGITSPADRTEGIDMLREIEALARISHRAEDKQTLDSWERFIKAVVVDKGDWSVCEHLVVTVIARVDRGVSHEWVRHRIGSYTQESTRFVNYQKKGNCLEFIKPVELEKTAIWETGLEQAENAYFTMLNMGVRPQEARSVLPNALATTIAVTYNLRSWRQFFLMRTSRETHPDFRCITIPLLAEFKKRIPLLYDDIEPNVRQIDHLRNAR